MLLNEVQQQQRKNETQAAEIGELKKRQLITEAEQMRMRQQVAELKDLKEQIALMAAALHTLEAKDKVVARR
jgi:hypothetical protein